MATKGRTTSMANDQMVQVQRELGGITESLKNAEEYRQEVLRRLDAQTTKQDDQNTRFNDKLDVQNDKIDKIGRDLDAVRQTLISSSSAIANLTLENCGARLASLETLVKSYPTLENYIEKWKWLLGGTLGAIGKIIIAILSSGVIGGLVVHYFTK